MDYYRALLRQKGGLPSRGDIRPADLKAILPWVVIASRSGPRDFTPLVVGSGIDELLQASYTGVNLFDRWEENEAAIMDAHYGRVLAQPCAGLLVRTIEGRFGVLKDYQSFLLPLVGDDGVVDRFLGSISVAELPPNDLSFGKPDELGTLAINSITYFDIGFGVPPAADYNRRPVLA